MDWRDEQIEWEADGEAVVTPHHFQAVRDQSPGLVLAGSTSQSSLVPRKPSSTSAMVR
jgi:hypothetical protein